VADAQDTLHQIEYRHHQTKDLAPIASSMSPESLRRWDSQIRTWVRHPQADRLAESVCYKALPAGQAALAWRYRDQQAAERADGLPGRPLVSRVLVGQESLLTSRVAIAICRAGLPSVPIGPPPGQVTADIQLPAIGAGHVAALMRELTPVLDEEAGHPDGLSSLHAVVAAALQDPACALAIQVRDTLIQRPVREGVQPRLLWGLHTIVATLLGPRGPEWSFSTFELPLGAVDPSILPRIVFRQAQPAGPPPARTRREIRVRPFDPAALAASVTDGQEAEFAAGLVAEYAKRGGKGFEELIAECCGAERAVQARLRRVYAELLAGDWLGAREAGARAPAPPRPEPGAAGATTVMPVEPESLRSDAAGPPAAEPELLDLEAENLDAEPIAEPAVADLASGGFEATEPGNAGVPGPDAVPAREAPARVADGDGQAPVNQESPSSPADHEIHSRHDPWASPLAPPRGASAPHLPVFDHSPDPRYPPGDSPQYPEAAQRFPPLNALLRKLETAQKGEFEPVIEAIYIVGSQGTDHAERDQCRKIMANDHWYNNVCNQLDGEPPIEKLGVIFAVIVLPDMADHGVAGSVARWVSHARPQVVAGLLAAAREESLQTWQAMVRLLTPVLADRWTAEQRIQPYWRPDVAPGAADEQGRKSWVKNLKRPWGSKS
jgi:hypothetical protein